jgi:cytoskeletal protein RodZ
MKPLMIFLMATVFWSPFLLSAAPTPPPEATPSNAALRAIVEHMQRLAKDQQENLEKEKGGHQQADSSLETTSTTLALATTQIITLQKQVNTQTDKLNSTQDKLDKAETALWWYRLHWWGAWVMLALGIAACLFFAFLKVTGRLAILGAAVAAKVP